MSITNWKLALIIILSIIIGATTTYNYIEGKNLYNFIRIGYAYAATPNIGSSVSADEFVGGNFDKSDGEVDLVASPNDIINKYDWDTKVAYAVAKAESNLNPKAFNQNTNGSWDAGLFQINSIHGHSREEMENPEKNIEAAYQIYLKAGRQFTPWVVFNRKFYLNEL